MEKFNRLKELLRTMFQLDRGDLDFGLYRIMNLKAREIEEFLENDLLPQVQSALAGNVADRQAELEKELAEARLQASGLGVDPETTPRYKELEQQLAEVKADVAAEADVYNHLANFFARYYDEGDFMSLRRYSGGGQSTYLIPYDGEEVKLHWANSDQYYIKTTENYASYVFTVGTGEEKRRVRFEIAKADNEKDNVKETSDKQRRFLLAEGDDAKTIEVVDSDLVVRFSHRPLTESEKKTWKGSNNKQQELINIAAAERILKTLKPEWQILLAVGDPTESNPERTVLDKHLATYTAKNSFDYFIHKDLGGFLRRELDLYLKTDVLKLDDLAAGDTTRLQRVLARTRAVRHVADRIITFLAQIEDFQKQLWLKKKFVLETQYCVTLDRVPETLFPEIAANEAQHDEWLKLFAIDEIEGDLANGNTGYTNPLTVEFLKANPYLVLDTRHFGHDFTDRLLAALSEEQRLEDQLDGLLIHGENFQALNLLRTGYSGKVSCVYIDPPYNTGDSEILYKNGYLRSSWLSLISNNLNTVKNILAPDSIFYIAIDDFEMSNLAKLLDTQCPWLRREMIIINHHPQGGKAKVIASTHEYMLACINESTDKTLVGRQIDDGVEMRPFKRSGTAESNFRYARQNSFYAILVDPESHTVVGLEPPPSGTYPKGRTENNLIRIYPIGTKGDERVWRRAYEPCKELLKKNKLICTDKLTIYQKIEVEERKAALFSNWVDPRYNAGTFGANLLSDIIGKHNPFSYPKSVHTVGDAIFAADLELDALVVDYFAGSGTTGHAVINLNREDEGKRKYILVEVGDHFDTVLLPRIKKVVYSPNWKEGRPVSRSGSTQFFKYIRLEAYEDTLDSLELKAPQTAQQDILVHNAALREDYQLRYALGEETSGSACLLGKNFIDPFAYTLSVVRDGVRAEVPVDLPETFNFLIGLRSEFRWKVEDVLAITGTDAEGQRCLILWRNLDGTNNSALDAWFTRNRDNFSNLDIIYTNGDHTLNALKEANESWTSKTIEPIFREQMFRGEDA